MKINEVEFINDEELDRIRLYCKNVLKLDQNDISIDEVTGMVDCNTNFYLPGNIYKLEIKFGRIDGDFSFSDTDLATLEGSPVSITGNFYCNRTNITTLQYMPKVINRGCMFMENKIDPYEYRWALYSTIGGFFHCGVDEIDDIFKKYHGQKSKIPAAIVALKALRS